MSVSEAYNFKAIDELVSTSGVISAEQLDCLASEGYQDVLNLLPHHSEYALPGEQQRVEGQGLGYHYIPVEWESPLSEQYRQFEQIMAQLKGRKLMIHCAANYRVSAFYAIYACRNLGWREAQAREHIESIWNPAEHPQWQILIDQLLEE